MISKLPGWVSSVSWGLAFMAGIVNVTGILGFEHRAVTHLTGNTSTLAAAIAALDWTASLHLFALMGAFVAGSALSGFIIQDSALKLGRRYGLVLFLESVSLFLAVPLLHREIMAGLYLAAIACGLQNAMVSTYSGTVVRTTHVSGMFTDLGISLGHLLRGIPLDSKRVKLSLSVISGFFCGGIVGAVTYRSVGPYSLVIPASMAGAASLAYALIRQWNPRG